jgi:hypothetical protein
MSSSDDEGDVVVMRVCAGVGCVETFGLEFDEGIGESFCTECLQKLRQAEADNDFRILLSADDRGAIELIFNKFDFDRKGYWTFEEFNAYLEATDANRNDPVGPFDSNAEMSAYFDEEYAVPTASVDVPAAVVGLPEGTVTISNIVTLEVMEKIYGGYMYHGVNALRDDVDALEDAGEVNFDVLE